MSAHFLENRSVSPAVKANGCLRAGYGCDSDCSVCVPSGGEGQVSCSGHQAGGGGHLPDGGACGPSLGDGGLVNWSAAVEVSANALTSSEAEGSLLIGSGFRARERFHGCSGGCRYARFRTNWIGLATSAQDGASFTSQPPLVGPTPAPSPGIQAWGWTRAARCIWPMPATIPRSGVSDTCGSRSRRVAASFGSPQDALGPSDLWDAGGGIDWPFLAVNPVTQQPMIAFADFAGSFGGVGPYRIKLIAGQEGASGFLPSIDIDDGTRGAFRDLPSMAFDQTGMLYLAWVEASDSNSVDEDQTVGAQLTGSITNAIYFKTANTKDGGAVVPGAKDHLVSWGRGRIHRGGQRAHRGRSRRHRGLCDLCGGLRRRRHGHRARRQSRPGIHLAGSRHRQRSAGLRHPFPSLTVPGREEPALG